MKKEEILERALELFADRGYDGTSMDDIAKASGIKKASLYSHYSGKESIFTAVFDGILKYYISFINSLTYLTEKTKSRGKLESIFIGYVNNCSNNSRMAFWERFYYYPPEYLKGYVFNKTYETETFLVKKITQIIEQGIKSGEIKNINAYDMALSFYFMMIGFAMSVRFYDEKGIHTDIAKCITVFLNGIKTS